MAVSGGSDAPSKNPRVDLKETLTEVGPQVREEPLQMGNASVVKKAKNCIDENTSQVTKTEDHYTILRPRYVVRKQKDRVSKIHRHVFINAWHILKASDQLCVWARMDTKSTEQ